MNVIVIGSGKLGQRHLQKWSKMEDVEVVGVIARNQKRLKDVANQFDTQAYMSIAEAIQQTNVDLIDICTPTHTHVDFIQESAKAKKHVICEKPLALNKKEARQAIQICKKHEVHLFVGHTLRFFPQYAYAREMVLKEKIGNIGLINLERGTARPVTGWYSDYDKSGGLFMDLGIHDLDWLLWTLGDVQEVIAKEVKDHAQQITYGVATLRMTNGSIAHIKLSWEEKEFYSSFEIIGNKGIISNDTNDDEALLFKAYGESPEDPGERKETKLAVPKKKDPFYRQLEHFLNCIRGKEHPIVTAEDAFKAVELSEAIVKSAETGQTVELNKYLT